MPSQKKRPKRPKTVYIIEDDQDLAIVLQEHLRLNGYLTKTCTSDFEDHLLTEQVWGDVDVLVMDLWLTNDGIITHFPTATKILKYVSQYHPYVRRIIYTAFDQRIVDNVIEQSIREMSDAFLTKPSPIRVIIDEIEKKR